MSTTMTDDDLALRRTYGAVALCGIALTMGAATWVGALWGVSILAGALIALGNLWVLSRAVRNLLAPGGSPFPWSVVAVVKFFLLLTVTYLLVRSPRIEPLGLALGFGALPLGVVLGSVLQTPAPTRRAAAGRLNEETDHA